MAKITKRVVDGLQPDPTRQIFVWDGELRGFGVCVKPSGAMSYIIQYRTEEGRSHRLVIGKAGTLTPDEARGIARDKLASVAKGSNPAAERKATREAITVAELCDWYLEGAAKGTILGKGGRRIKPSTLAMDRSRINTHVKPLLGNKTVRSLTLDNVEQLQADVAAGRTAKKRNGRGAATTGGSGVAARTAGMLQTILEHATRKKLINDNPARGLRKLADKKRERRLVDDEIAALGTAMRAAADEGENATALSAIRTLLLTGFRRQEALGLKRPWIDERLRGVRFPDTKSGAQVRPLGRAAIEALKAAPVEDGSDWVFPAARGDGQFVGIVKALDRVCARAGLNGVSPHVLRHTFASVAGDLGFSELTIKGLLGHAAQGVTQRYVHLDQSLLLAADRVSAHIAYLLDGMEASGEVVELRRLSA